MKISPKSNLAKVVTVNDAVGRALLKGGKFVEAGAKVEKVERVIVPEEPEVEISPITGKPKRQYRRRDMQAE